MKQLFWSLKPSAGLRVLAAGLILALLVGLCGCGAGTKTDSNAARESRTTAAADSAATDAGTEAPAESTALPEPDGTGGETEAPADPAAAVDAAQIVEGSHHREAAYMAEFRTKVLSVGSLSVHMESRIFEEARLRALAKAVLQDLAAAEAAVGEAPDAVTVYLVKEPNGGAPVRVDHQIFCAAGDVESGAYRDRLFGAAFGLREAWQQAGLTEYLFGEADEDSLRAWYAEGAHSLTASCSVLHLSPILSEPETVRAARATARSLTAFLLERDGLAAFRAAETTGDLLPAWAEAMGLSPAPVLPENCGELAGLTLEAKANGQCILQLRNFTVSLTQDSWLRDPDGLYQWFSDFLAGMALELDRIRTEAPSAAEVVEQRFGAPIQIDFTDAYQVSVTDFYSKHIYLSRYDAIWHEMGHILLTTDSRDEFQWLNEATADYFSFSATARFAPTRYICQGLEAYEEIFASYLTDTEAAPDDLVFHECVWTLYESFRDPAQTETDDLEAYNRAYGICTLLLDGRITRTQFRTRYDRSIAYGYGRTAGRTDTDPMALTYSQSLALFEYLCMLHGTDAVMDAFLNRIGTEEAFGLSYPQLFAEAKAWYADRYLDLLPLG